MPILPSGGARWIDANGASAASLRHVYFVQDPGTGAWSLSTNRRNEAARLADSDGDGDYELVLLEELTPLMPTLRIALLTGGASVFY